MKDEAGGTARTEIKCWNNEVDMDVLFYTEREIEPFLSVLHWARSVIPAEKLKICRTLRDLEHELRRQHARCRLAVINVGSAAEMDGLLLVRHLLDDIRLILLVPEMDRETAHKGHQLYPRFMTDIHIETNRLTAVIKGNLEYLKIEQLASAHERIRTEGTNR